MSHLKGPDRSVQTPDQIRTPIRTFRDKLPEIYPGREHTPQTLIFAKERGGSSEHPVNARPPSDQAEKIVEIVREKFGKGNEFAQKITYRGTCETPERQIATVDGVRH
jgi:type I restriction enzyme R subunit